MPQGWSVVPETTAPSAPDGWTPVPDQPTFRTSNEKDASGNAVVDPNTLGTLARHLWNGINPVQIGQMLPFPKALGGSGTDNPLNPKKIADDLFAVKKQAQAAMERGDYTTAVAKYVESVIPVLGPWMSGQGNQLQQGRYAAVAGDTLGLAANMALPKAVSAATEAAYPLAGRAAATATAPKVAPEVQFAQQRGIPLDASTVSNNFAVKGVQNLADRSLGGSLVATPAREAQAAAMGRTGESIAGDVSPAVATPEQAGLSVQQALAAKVAEHTQTANTAYDTIRALEQQPGNQVTMPGKTPAMAAQTPDMIGQVRRMVHELDAAPYTPRLLQPGAVGSSLEHVEGTGGAGAKVFDDIVQRAGSTATRGVVQNQLETYLGGGPETNIVKAALDVAADRAKGRGGFTVSKPELPPSAMDVPTRLEGVPKGQEMGFPVDVKSIKPALQPVYDQMMRQLPIARQMDSPGLKSLQNILEGPDYAPLSQVDRDLSAIKTVAREQGGLAKFAAGKLDDAVTQAAANGGPEVEQALQTGRQATITKYAAQEQLDALTRLGQAEPVRAIKALTAPKDSAIQQLRAVLSHTPEQAPIIGRGYLEDLLDSPKAVSQWNNLGAQTKALLFPGQSEALDRFFALKDRLSKTNTNPSGTAHLISQGAQGVMIVTNPMTAIPTQIGAAALAKMLRSKTAIDALTKGMSLSVNTPAVVRAATAAKILQAAQDAGAPVAYPRAADSGAGQ